MEKTKSNLLGAKSQGEDWLRSVVKEEVERAIGGRSGEGIRTYTTAEVCSLLHVCRTTLWTRVKAGEITPMKKGGKLLYSEEQIKDYLKR